MRVAIFGAGAIGGLLGVKLAEAGADVTFIARGPHLAAMQANGVTLVSGETRTVVHPRCLADPAEAGVQDYRRRHAEGARLAGCSTADREDDRAPTARW